MFVQKVIDYNFDALMMKQVAISQSSMSQVFR